MRPTASIPFTLLQLATVMLCSSCVGRGKYLESLLAQEAARSEAASAKTDLGDAAARYASLQADYAELMSRYEAQRSAAYQQQSGDLTERQELLRERTVQGLIIDSLRGERERLSVQRAGALALLDRHAERLRQIRARLAGRTGNFLPGQFSLTTADAAVVLEVDARAIFAEKRTPKIADVGDASLANIAGALGGQPDLLIDVVVAPSVADGSPKSRQEAAQRAALVVSNLVEGHGLLPESVRAVAVQTDAASASVAGLVEGGAPQRIQFVVRVPGDWLGRVEGALR